MLRKPKRLRALIVRGLALAGILAFANASTLAQDGQQETGPPVTEPGTNKFNPRANTSTPPIQDADQSLPPVPASIEDPAPPGTNAVPVVPGDIQRVRPRATRRAQSQDRVQILSTEGVVVQIEPFEDEPTRPGLRSNLVRLRIDPSQSWDEFAHSGPLTPAEDDAALDQAGPEDQPVAPREPRDRELESEPQARADEETPILNDVQSLVQDVKQVVRSAKAVAQPRQRDLEANDDGRDGIVEVVVTNRTRVFVHARTAEGVDLFGAETISSPDMAPGGGDVPGLVRAEPFSTNFTNIRVGSYVAVRYRPIGQRNEAVNVNLIELPLNPTFEDRAEPAEAEIREVLPGELVPALPGEIIRQPVVPAQQTGPSFPR